MDNKKLSEKEMLEDVLFTEEALSLKYSLYISRCVTTSLREQFLSISGDVQKMLGACVDESKKRGWYKQEEAKQPEINQVLGLFSAQEE